jgi:hypothetical protein
LLLGCDAVRSLPGLAASPRQGWSSVGECDVDLPHPHGDDLVADLDVVPGQRDDVLHLLAEDEDEDGGRGRAV